jgi:hypothetical protein
MQFSGEEQIQRKQELEFIKQTFTYHEILKAYACEHGKFLAQINVLVDDLGKQINTQSSHIEELQPCGK